MSGLGHGSRLSQASTCCQCKYLFACNGECPKNRIIKTASGQPGLNYLCSGTKRFLAHAEPTLHQIAAKVQSQMEQRLGTVMDTMN